MSEYKTLVQTIKEHNTPVDLNEVTDQEIKAVKKLSKDMEKIKKDYFKIAKMGDKTLQLKGFNKQYESILKAQQEILKIIGDMSTMKSMSDRAQKNEEVVSERYNKKADIYDDDYRNQVKYNLRQKMMRLKKEKGPNWNNDYKDAQKHHDAIVKIDKQVEKDRKEYEVLTKKNNQDEFLKYLGDEVETY